MNVPKILTIQSQVMAGFVGNRCAQVFIEGLGCQAYLFPTIVQTFHGASKPRKCYLPEDFYQEALAEILALNPDFIVTGYFAQGSQIKELNLQLEKHDWPKEKLLVDPVLGDYPQGLYVSESVKEAFLGGFLDKAGYLTPNQFEAQLLTGIPWQGLESAEDMHKAFWLRGEYLGVVVTKVNVNREKRAYSLLFLPQECWLISTPLYERDLYGAGDMFNGVLAALLAQKKPFIDAVSLASGIAALGVKTGYNLGLDTVNPLFTLQGLQALPETEWISYLDVQKEKIW